MCWEELTGVRYSGEWLDCLIREGRRRGGDYSNIGIVEASCFEGHLPQEWYCFKRSILLSQSACPCFMYSRQCGVTQDLGAPGRGVTCGEAWDEDGEEKKGNEMVSG